MNRLNKCFLLLVFVLNFFVRFYALGSSPAEVNWDEASLGINAKCLGINLKDDYGNFLPLNLKSLGDYKPALYSYLSIIPVKFLGLSAFSIRLVSALAGVIALWGIYKFLNIYVKNDIIKAIGILIIGFGPLRLHYSRVALETNLSAMFVIWSMYWLYFKRFRKAIIMAILGMLSYHSARVTIPLLVFLLMVDPIKIIKRRKIKIDWDYKWALVVLGAVFLFLLFVVKGSLNRFGTESIFRWWPFVPRNIGNAIYYLGFDVSGRIFSSLNPNNWISLNYDWFKNSVSYIAQSGILGINMSILVILAVFSGIDWLKKEYRFLLYWFFAGVVPLLLTWNWFYPLRSFNAIPVLEIVGIVGLESLLKEKKHWLPVFILMFWEMFYTVNNEINYSYFRNFNAYQATGIRAMTNYLKEKKFDRVIVDTRQENAYLFYQFYGDESCSTIQNVNENKALGYGKFVFRKINWEEDLKLKNTILISEETTMDYIAKEKGWRVKMFDSPLKSYQASMLMEKD